MTLDELRSQAAELFPAAVQHSIHHPAERNEAYDKLSAMCWVHFRHLGFECMSDCFDAAVPKTEGELTIRSWSQAEVRSLPWTMRVRCRPLRFTEHHAHFEIHHDGPLPGITETGYRSMFVSMATFADITPAEFIHSEICKDLPKSSQMMLF